MPRSGITYESTVSAINGLLAAGVAPTIDRIRSELGDTGSRSTINKYLRKWKKEERPAVIPGSGQSAEMPDLVSIAVNKVIQEKYEEARSEYATRLESAEEDALALEQSLSESEEENKVQLEQNRELASMLAAEKMQSERLNEEIVTIREQSHITISSSEDKAEEERKAAESARIETAELRLKLEHYEELKNNMRELREELKAAVAATAKADKEAAAANARNEGSEAQIKAFRTGENKAEEERKVAESARIEAAELRLKLEHYDESKKEMKDLRAQLKKAELATVAAEKDLAAVKVRQEGSEAQIKTLEHALASVEKQLEGK